MADERTKVLIPGDRGDSQPGLLRPGVRDGDPEQTPDTDIEQESSPGERAFRVVSGAPQRYRSIALGLASTDAIVIFVALFISYRIRWGSDAMPSGYVAVMFVMPLLWMIVFRAMGLYAPQLLSPWEEFRRTITATSFGIVLLTLMSFWTKASFSRVWVGLTFVIVILLELLSRRAWQGYIRRLKIKGILSLRTLIVGSGLEGEKLLEAVRPDHTGFLPVGFISTGKKSNTVSPDKDVPLLGGVHDLVEVIFDYGVDCLFLVARNIDQNEMVHIAQVARQQQAEIRLSTNLPEILTPRLTVQPLEGLMTLSVRPVHLTGTQTVMKRAFDLVVAGTGLLLITPLLLAIAVGIKVSSRGSVLFKQNRVTKGGHIFKMYKFRTMRQDADAYVEKMGIDTSVPFFKMGDDDPRLTRIGAFLRKTSLDELPQLFNVIRGNMSLVGPRPLPADQVAANMDLLGPRHEVPAGVTGWWQIQGRSGIEDADEAVRMDIFYIENWSLALDLFVLLKTAGAVIAKRGAM
jgi:exopolysaccharide biosynthesis polyprenyl glycosylphosphotransferase